ncbi:MAG: DUF2207 domain-containing protein [Clostridiaceae bacterium]
MRLKKNNLLILLIFAFSILLLPAKVALARDYTIDKYEMLYDVKKNGDVYVTEDLTYNFDGSYSGVFRDIDTDGTSGIDNLSVSVLENGNERELYMIDQGLGKQGNFEYYQQSPGIMRVKIYEASDSVKKTFRIRFNLKNLAIRYDDIGTLNRKIVDRNWQVPLNNVTATIKIPEGAKKEDLRIFSHGDLTGWDEIIDGNTYKVSIASVNPGETVETLAIFPKDLISDSQRYVNEVRLPTILQQEAVNADAANKAREEAQKEYEQMLEAERKREEKLAFGRQVTPILGALGAGALGIIAFIASKFGKERKPGFTGDYYRELPGDYTPAVMSYLMFNRQVESKDIMATLMDLSRKKLIKIEPVEVEVRRLLGSKTEVDYVISPTGNNDFSGLATHEKFLYDWFIKDLAGGGSIAMDELEKMLKKTGNARQFTADFERFKMYVNDEAIDQQFFERNSTKGIGKFNLIALGLMALGLLALVLYENFVGLVPIIGGILILITSAGLTFKQRLTQYGADQTSMWKAFKKFLLTFSKLDKAEIPALAIWNHYLVYATSLGVAKEVIDQLPFVYSPEELQTATGQGFYPTFYYGGHFNRMNNAMNSAVQTATNTIRTQQIAQSRRSSSGGFGGGFSGGSSGGSGGGGGGGAF